MNRKYEYDAFISHAVEDKLPIANDLCNRLEAAGLKIWYSGSELNAGDSIEGTVHEGLSKSRFGIVIFSKNYIDKNWPIREFYHLLAREREDGKVILPVLFNITPGELAAKDLTMADRFAINANKGLDYVVERLLQAINETGTATVKKRGRRNTLLALIALAVIAIPSTIFLFRSSGNAIKNPSKALIKKTIEDRVEAVSKKINPVYVHDFVALGASQCTMSVLDILYQTYKDQKSHYRNEYEFFDGKHSVRSRKNVEALLKIDVAALNPGNAYEMKQPYSYVLKKDGWAKYALLNTQPIDFTSASEKQINDSIFSVTVKYVNNIRYLEVELLFNNSMSSGIKRHQMLLIGLPPEETFLFKRRNGQWSLSGLQ